MGPVRPSRRGGSEVIITSMTRALDVLVLENRPGAARRAEEELTAAGHRVHRCYRRGDRGFPCAAVLDPGGCPLDQHVDVALLVRDRVTPRPQPLESGVSCAIRAGIPLVEEGPDVLDPYDPWVLDRVPPGNGIVGVCERAADRSFDGLRAQVRRRIAALLHAAGILPDEVECRFELQGAALRVELLVDAPVCRELHQALAVRVLDAVRTDRRTYGQVDVQVRGREEVPTLV